MENARQKGYLLIEVMVTILLLAIGVTGFTALLLMTVRMNLEAQDKSDLTQTSAAILDHLRLHPKDAADGVFNIRASTDSSNSAYPTGNFGLTEITEPLNARGTIAWIEIFCEADGFTVCEVCLENVGLFNMGTRMPNEEDANISACSRQIIM